MLKVGGSRVVASVETMAISEVSIVRAAFLVQCLVPWALRQGFATAEDGLLANGDFETSPAVSFHNGTYAEGVESLPSWRIQGTVEYVKVGQRQGSMLLVVPEGSHAARLGNDAQISQQITVEKGSMYSLTFSAARTCAQLESLNVSVPPATRTVDLQTLYNVEGWDAYAWAFQAAAEDAQVTFRNPGMEDDPTCGPIIDAVAIKQISTPERQQGNAVINGDFEEGPWMFRNATLGVLLPTNLDEETSSVPGWMVESNKAVRYIDSDHYSVPQGKRAVELLSGKEGIISQMVETVAGRTYNLSFLLGDAGDSCQEPLAVTVFAGDQQENIHYMSPTVRSYEHNNITFTAKAERTRIAFYSVYYNTRSVDRSSLCGPVIDSVRVADLSRSGAGSARVFSAADWGVPVALLALIFVALRA